MLVIIQNRNEHVEVVEQRREPAVPRKAQIDVARAAPIRPRHQGRLDAPSERLKQVVHKGFATARWQWDNAGFQRYRGIREVLPVPCRTRHRAAQHLGHRNRQQGRGGVGPIIDVLILQTVTRPAATNKAHRIYVQDQDRLAPVLGRNRIEEMRLAERQVGLVAAVWMLMEQIAQIGCRAVGGGD